MRYKSLFFTFLVCTPLLNSPSSYSNNGSDPYAPIRYEQAFNQTEINKKYAATLQHMGCADNVFGEDFSDENSVQELTPEQLQNSFKKYQAECLKKLIDARFFALAEPGIMAGAEITLLACAALTTLYCVGNESMGGSFSVFSFAINTAFTLPHLAMGIKNVISKPNNSLAALETRFAMNQCFIPNCLWPKIIESFAEARQNNFAREVQTNFLNFALDITTFKPKPFAQFKDGMTLQEVKAELRARINTFFKDYENSDASLHAINRNVSKFIDCIMQYQTRSKLNTAPRYMYLHGMGGIGKTHFVKKLSEWINELIPNGIRFEDVIIESDHQLEGNDKHPGVILNTLRSQLRDEKIGSLLLIDEATWLNHCKMIDAAKRVFNGNQTKLSTKYLNTEELESSFAIPPMLIFVANNDEIEDGALATRFDLIHYPTPSKTMLIEHALTIAHQSNHLKTIGCYVDDAKIIAWVQSLTGSENNFRHIDGHVEDMLESVMG